MNTMTGITVLGPDPAGEHKIGFAIRETIGDVFINPMLLKPDFSIGIYDEKPLDGDGHAIFEKSRPSRTVLY